VFLSPSPELRAKLEAEEYSEDPSPRWLCRYLDGYPCFDCGTVDLAVVDLPLLLECEGHEWDLSGRDCPACGGACREPRYLESEAAPGMLMAFLEPKYGAPLWGRLCASCGRVWLSLEAGDAVARRELAERFPDAGRCSRCEEGRVRLTRIDAPYCGYVGLWHPPEGEAASAAGAEGSRRAAWILLAMCDACGEAATRLEVGE
jgi:hypothetical protein